MRGPTPRTLAKYALAQGVDVTEQEAQTFYDQWKRTHAADALVFERAHQLIDREYGDDGCAWPHCRDEGSATCYLRGSTELTRAQDASFCDQHLKDFCRALDVVRGISDEDEDE